MNHDSLEEYSLRSFTISEGISPRLSGIKLQLNEIECLIEEYNNLGRAGIKNTIIMPDRISMNRPSQKGKEMVKDEAGDTGDVALLTIRPLEQLEFCKIEDHQRSLGVISLSNNTKRYVAYKVKTTTPERYCARDSSGIIGPNDSTDIRTFLKYSVEDDTDLSQDKFLIMFKEVNSNCRYADIKPMFRAVRRGKCHYNKHRLHCKLGPAQASQMDMNIALQAKYDIPIRPTIKCDPDDIPGGLNDLVYKSLKERDSMKVGNEDVSTAGKSTKSSKQDVLDNYLTKNSQSSIFKTGKHIDDEQRGPYIKSESPGEYPKESSPDLSPTYESDSIDNPSDSMPSGLECDTAYNAPYTQSLSPYTRLSGTTAWSATTAETTPIPPSSISPTASNSTTVTTPTGKAVHMDELSSHGGGSDSQQSRYLSSRAKSEPPFKQSQCDTSTRQDTTLAFARADNVRNVTSAASERQRSYSKCVCIAVKDSLGYLCISLGLAMLLILSIFVCFQFYHFTMDSAHITDEVINIAEDDLMRQVTKGVKEPEGVIQSLFTYFTPWQDHAKISEHPYGDKIFAACDPYYL